MAYKKTILYALALCLWLFANIASAQFPSAVRNAMAERGERYHHYLWHNFRNNWNRYSSSTRAEITRRGWAPPRPALRYDSNGNSVAILDNNSGEDFLYMHRQMITRARSLAGSSSSAQQYFVGWTRIPAPGDRDYPVPSTYTVPGSSSTTSSIRTRKTTSFYNNNIVPMENRLNDPDELRDMTLGELGATIEFTIHNWLHIRFSASESYGYRPGGSGTFPYFDERWDNPSYDWLGDTYSSHVNPVFWKLHGWVDNKIEAWRIANGLSSITWRGTWTGGPMSSLSDILDTSSANAANNVAADVGSLANEPALESSFADPVQVNLGRRRRPRILFSEMPQSNGRPARVRRLRGNRRV